MKHNWHKKGVSRETRGAGQLWSTQIKVLFFDVFGTVVDWRNGIAKQLSEFDFHSYCENDWYQLADEWRSLYQPSMESVRSGQRPWANLDQLHMESLRTILKKYNIMPNTNREIEKLNQSWHFLDPWPDSCEGLNRLKQSYIISTQSNGNTRLLVDMAKYGNLPWDVILGAESAKCYKPLPDAYLNNIGLLGFEPEECMMVAAHNDDLAAAQKIGMKTAFVLRKTEHGPNQTTDLAAEGSWDISADDFVDLSNILSD